MVASPALLGFLAAITGAIFIALAEWLHNRRIARIAYLAFGTRGRSRRWAAFAPAVRVVSGSLLAFGLMVLYWMAPKAIEKEPSQEASKHLLVCLDASPSMFVEDAGPNGKVKRAIWAGEVIQAILDRLDTETTRVTVFAVYTKSIPVIEETFDRNVVRNLLDGLPLFAAFEAGPTKLSTGVADALNYARKWQPKSATLVIISDGDSEEKTAVRSIPSSIADTIVIGVGDPIRPTMVSGHRSTQDTASLKLLASKLNGVYHQGNNKQLPSHIVNKLTMVRPRVTDGIGLRELALASIAFGGTVLCFLGPALLLFGKRIDHLPAVLVAPSELKWDKSPVKNNWVKPSMIKNGVS